MRPLPSPPDILDENDADRSRWCSMSVERRRTDRSNGVVIMSDLNGS